MPGNAVGGPGSPSPRTASPASAGSGSVGQGGLWAGPVGGGFVGVPVTVGVSHAMQHVPVTQQQHPHTLQHPHQHVHQPHMSPQAHHPQLHMPVPISIPLALSFASSSTSSVGSERDTASVSASSSAPASPASSVSSSVFSQFQNVLRIADWGPPAPQGGHNFSTQFGNPSVSPSPSPGALHLAQGGRIPNGPSVNAMSQTSSTRMAFLELWSVVDRDQLDAVNQSGGGGGGGGGSGVFDEAAAADLAELLRFDGDFGDDDGIETGRAFGIDLGFGAGLDGMGRTSMIEGIDPELAEAAAAAMAGVDGVDYGDAEGGSGNFFGAFADQTNTGQGEHVVKNKYSEQGTLVGVVGSGGVPVSGNEGQLEQGSDDEEVVMQDSDTFEWVAMEGVEGEDTGPDLYG
ncbi:hypothetical protein M427DRAFT_57474 [Gonapodya prolifera JEL478]|uniref:Uncharacterized protein n=1 Tax=Gonapodya prolifera (strain JEL478) TaxID=1344416 RepID=A0A139ACM4_GONPJ|nr:hypothetical protein M427DRAFT_57474 [Gonapodya prolifera JEL478]|eukprot:KXS14562.1 hypothetical protein M427DRAFT_57474 [Gonapodya prolifera JEL478]